MSAASDNLRTHQRQLDQDGVEVGVSRQAIHEVLSEYGAAIDALKALDACYCEAPDEMTRAQRDHHRKVLMAAREAVGKAEGSCDQPLGGTRVQMTNELEAEQMERELIALSDRANQLSGRTSRLTRHRWNRIWSNINSAIAGCREIIAAAATAAQ